MNIKLWAVESAQDRTKNPNASSLRVYASSLPGLLSLALYDDQAYSGPGMGIRLTRGQTIDLHKALTEYLLEGYDD